MTNEPVLAELVDQCDVVFHLAAAVGVKLIVEAPVRTSRPTSTAPRSCSSTRTRRRSWCSSRPPRRSTARATRCRSARTRDLVLGPDVKHRWAYACSKAHRRVPGAGLLEGEEGCRSSSSGCSTRSGRGRPGATAWSSRPSCGRRWPGEPITVFGDGTQTRCFTYVGDVVGALIATGRPATRRSARSSTSATREEITILRPGRAGEGADAERVADRHDPVRPGLRGGLRGHAAARARHRRRSARSSATSRASTLDEILRLVIEYFSGRTEPCASAHPPARAPWRGVVAATQREAAPPAPAPRRARPRAAPARHRPDREHQHLQRQVRLLPARRHAAQAGHHGHGAVPEDRRRVRGARHRPRAAAQLRRGRSSTGAAGEDRATRSRAASPKSA